VNLAEMLLDQGEKGARVNRIYGVVTGIVTDNHDPDGRARVKITFPWLAEHTESDWAKVVSFMAGKDRGATFLPEVGDEVLVAFEHGDIHYPYVLGALWNSEDPPPESNRDGKNNIRKLKSRSGHEIILDDSQGAEKIVIRDKSGANVVTFDSLKGEISLESQMTLKIQSPQIEIEAEMAMKLSAPQIEIEAEMAMKLSAGAVLEIKGAMVTIN
jgi:uncharacterized protein involved in type VI secretion and phage assembly